MKIYHAANARSMRVIWAAEELGLPYELQTLNFTPEELKSPAYLAVHPLGAVPAIDDDGLVLHESGAIVQYLQSKAGNRLQPAPDGRDYGRYLQWFHFAEATAMPPLSTIAQNAMLKPEEKRIPATIPEAAEKFGQIVAVIERELQDRDYIAGAGFTAADIMLGYALHLGALLGLLGDAAPKTKAYYERLAARPGFRKAL